jgi:hypothetical protein
MITFTEEVCKPIKQAEVWIAAKKKLLRESGWFAGFLRVSEFLMTGRARLLIIGV